MAHAQRIQQLMVHVDQSFQGALGALRHISHYYNDYNNNNHHNTKIASSVHDMHADNRTFRWLEACNALRADTLDRIQDRVHHGRELHTSRQTDEQANRRPTRDTHTIQCRE